MKKFSLDFLLCTECPKKRRRLIWCKLGTTVFTLSTFILSVSSYFNLKFGIKQSKIGWKLAEEWLPKAKILAPVDEQTIRFFWKKCSNLKQPYCFIKVQQNVKITWNWKDTIVLLSYQVTKLFAVPKACTRWKTKGGIGIIIFMLMATLVISRIFSEACMYISNKRNYKTFTKGPPLYISLLNCIVNIFNHSSGKCRDSLTIVALSFTKSTGLCAIFIH